MRNFWLFGTLLFFIWFSNKTLAQFYFAADLEGYYDDNIFNNYLNISDFVNAFSGELGYDVETEKNIFEVYYIGYANRYFEYQDKSSTVHKFGLVNTHLFSEYDNPLNVGINYTIRINKEGYYIYDYSQISAYANYMHSVGESNKIQFGIIGNRINYENFSLFSNYQLKTFLRSINSFESRTSITVAIEADQKLYVEQTRDPEYPNSLLQAQMFLQVGQGITESSGISVYAFYKKNLSGGNRYITSIDYIYYEDELFNDIYSSEGVETGVTLTYLFLPNVIGKLAGRYNLSDYTNLPVADEDGNELDKFRKDHQLSFGAAFEIGLGEMISGLYLSMNYNYVNNISNDYYYNYQNNLFAIALGFGF
jgi:hypothetical protein